MTTKRTPRVVASTKEFESVGTAPQDEKYVLRLFIAGTTPASTRAVEALGAICAEHLEGRFELEVIDVYQQPALAREEQIIALPTLVKKLPLPLRRVLGDLSNTSRVLVGLDLKPKPDEKAIRKTRTKK